MKFYPELRKGKLTYNGELVYELIDIKNSMIFDMIVNANIILEIEKKIYNELKFEINSIYLANENKKVRIELTEEEIKKLKNNVFSFEITEYMLENIISIDKDIELKFLEAINELVDE